MGKSRTEKRKRYVLRRLFWWALACLWCAMAVYLSRQTGEQTTQLGLFVTDLTEKVLVRLGAFVPERVFGVLERYLPQTLVTLLRGEHVKSVYLHMFLRKAAHVGVYLGLGFLLMRAWAASMAARGRGQLWAILPAGLLGSVVAVLDELQKKYIPGRHCDWGEAQLNIAALGAGLLAGLVFGMIFWLLLLPFRRRRRGGRRRRASGGRKAARPESGLTENESEFQNN